MNRLQATISQNTAIARVNLFRETDKFVKRLYQSRLPLGTANEALEKHMISEGLVFRQNGPLLALTYKGKEFAKEIGR